VCVCGERDLKGVNGRRILQKTVAGEMGRLEQRCGTISSAKQRKNAVVVHRQQGEPALHMLSLVSLVLLVVSISSFFLLSASSSSSPSLPCLLRDAQSSRNNAEPLCPPLFCYFPFVITLLLMIVIVPHSPNTQPSRERMHRRLLWLALRLLLHKGTTALPPDNHRHDQVPPKPSSSLRPAAATTTAAAVTGTPTTPAAAAAPLVRTAAAAAAAATAAAAAEAAVIEEDGWGNALLNKAIDTLHLTTKRPLPFFNDYDEDEDEDGDDLGAAAASLTLALAKAVGGLSGLDIAKEVYLGLLSRQHPFPFCAWQVIFDPQLFTPVLLDTNSVYWLQALHFRTRNDVFRITGRFPLVRYFGFQVRRVEEIVVWFPPYLPFISF